MLPQRQNSPFRDKYFCYPNLFQPPLCCHTGRDPLSGKETFFIQSFPGTTMLPQKQIFPFRDRDVCYSNLFQAPLCCHIGRVPLSGSETFVVQILSRHIYVATKTEFPFQGYRRFLFESFQGTTMLPQRQKSPFRDILLVESFPGATMPPQRQSSPFRDRGVCYSNLFQPPLCCHTGRVPISGSETFVIQIFSRHNYATTKTKFPFQE